MTTRLDTTPLASDSRHSGPIRFAIVGGGWRSQFFLRAAAAYPDRLEVTSVVARSGSTRALAEERFSVRTGATTDDAVRMGDPEFVLVAVPREVAPAITTAVVHEGLPVLEETPPATDTAGLRDLWDRVGRTGLVQVAEHSLVMPEHVATRNVVASGAIGRVTSVQVSSNHEYHAVAVMRDLLSTGGESVAVQANTFEAPLIDPYSAAGFDDRVSETRHSTTIATLDFGDGASGLYDFTDNQWWNPLRHRRLVTRGSRGEINDQKVLSLRSPDTVIESELTRRQTGTGMSHEGFRLDNIAYAGKVVYRNVLPVNPLSDEEIAATTLLIRMGRWVRDEGPEPYPLAEGMQDHALGLAIVESARTRALVRTVREPWAAALANRTVS